MSYASSHTGPPSIRFYDSGTARHGLSPIPLSLPGRPASINSIPAGPMPIPHAREAPPPPLPPPRYISGLDLGQHGADSNSYTRQSSWQPESPQDGVRVSPEFGAGRAGSSLLGAMRSREENSRAHDKFTGSPAGRNSLSSTSHPIDADMPDALDVSDEERFSTSRPSIVSRRLHSESQLGQRTLDRSSDAYDKRLLARMGGPNTAGAGSRSVARNPFHPSTTQEPSASAKCRDASEEPTGTLKPLAMLDRQHDPAKPLLACWSSTPCSSTTPGTTPCRPLEMSARPDSAHWRGRASATAPATAPVSDAHEGHRSKCNSEDRSVFMEHDFTMEDDIAMVDPSINERASVGSDEAQHGTEMSRKRHAHSPPPGNRETGADELHRRRSAQMLSSRNNSVSSRYTPAHGSVSSASSVGGNRNGSYASSMSWNHSLASSTTSYGDQASPLGLSLTCERENDYRPLSPNAASRKPDPSPHPNKGLPHQHTFAESEASQTRKMSNDSNARQSNVAHRPGLLICACCPKKPKKFESVADLRTHENEKQYQCLYCPNRFKNKNEAERHQNSLHLRRHSWSCAALTGVHAAFHPSGQPPAANDACGYCGDEFPNPPNWDQRGDHLNVVHKYGECNQQKKFFRADHFRQHLKHSHAGATGKHTNVLENACMKDEPLPLVPTSLPQKDRIGSLASMNNMGSPGRMAATSIRGVIDEVQEES